MQPPRTTAQRIADTQARLQADVDCWVSSANRQGDAYLIPLSYVWHDGQIIMATLSNGLTMRNLQRAGRCRLALDGTRDVVLIEGSVTIVPLADLPAAATAAFVTAAGFDPRQSTDDYRYLVVTPATIRAWREENELNNREIMRNGQWRGEKE